RKAVRRRKRSELARDGLAPRPCVRVLLAKSATRSLRAPGVASRIVPHCDRAPGEAGPGGAVASGELRSARFVTPAGVPIADPLDQDDADDPDDHAKAEADAGAEIGHRGYSSS